MIAALGVFFVLLAVRAAGFWSFLLGHPSSVDETSVRLWLGWGLLPIFLAVSAWAFAYGLGRRALTALRARPEGGLDRLAAFALGLAALGQAVFLLGWAGGLTPAGLGALFAVAAALAAARPALPAVPRPRWDSLTGAAAGLLAYAACVAVVVALAPAVDWDVLSYHLALPELALRAGRFAPVPWMIHSHWPHLMEALYAAPLAAGRDGAAALLHLGAAAGLVLGAFLLAKRRGGDAAGWIAALLLAGQPALLREAGTAHADAPCALFAFAAAWTWSRWDEDGGDGRLFAAGLLAGACAAAKMTGLAVVAGGGLAVAWKSRRARPVGVFAAGAALLAGPWFLKTWLETGSPAWPFAARDAAGAALAARYLASNRWGFPPPSSIFAHDGPPFLLLPAFALAALAPAPKARDRWDLVLLASAPFFLGATWLHHEQWRFLMPLWAVIAVGAGVRGSQAFRRGGARAAVAACAVAVGAAPLVTASPNNELFAVAGLRSAAAPGADRRALFLERTVDIAAFEREARAVLPPGARVLLFREVRGYGAGFDYLWGDPKNQALIDYRALPDADALAARLKALGVTFVLDHPGSGLYREDPGYYDRRTLDLMAETLRRRARVALDRGDAVLYELL